MSTSVPATLPLHRTEAAVRSAGVGVWLNALPLGALTWNDNTKAHFHLAPDATPTIELFYERLHADDRERVRQSVTRAVEDGAFFDEVYRTVGPDGQHKWIRATGRAVYDDRGQATQFDGITLDITGPVLAQRQLREFADSAPAILWVTEPDGVCTFLSRGWTDFTGQSETAGLGFGWLEMVHPEDRGEAESAFRDATLRRMSFKLEHRLRRSDGRFGWVLDEGRPRTGPAGEFLGFAGSVTDIHDRRLAEDALRRSNDRYTRLLASIDEGFCVVQIMLDANGQPSDYRFVETNAVFERQTGLDRPQGRTARELVPDLEPFWYETYGAVALSRQPQRFTHGSQAMGRWFDVYASPIGERDDLQVAILFQDVSDRVEQERRLLQSEERYRAFLANSTEGIWRMEFLPPIDTALPEGQQIEAIFDRGRLAECNDAFARMYGAASGDELVGCDLGAMMDRSDPRSIDYILGLVRAGYRSAEAESLERDKTGRPVWFANSVSGVVEAGQLVRAWGTQRDITARKEAEAALVEADRRKDEFLATLAHELRNPLAPIRSAADLLRLGTGRDERVSRLSDMIVRQVSHLSRLIDDLMDASRITRGKLQLDLEPVCMQDIVRTALHNVDDELRAGMHAVRLSMPESPIVLLGDEVRLVQVMLNLLTNAVRYSPAGRPIDVTVSLSVTQVAVSVRDQGIGMAADQIPRVFELFYQGGAESERSRGGLGIGLSLVDRIVALHQGTVAVRSEGLGHGSEFVVTLPITLATMAAPPAVSDEPLAGPRSTRVLVVDDNREAADTMAEFLQLSGYETSVAYDGVEGLAMAQTFRPDAAVLDLGMPRLDGFGLCRALREGPQGPAMLILAVSGWGQPADMERTAEVGFDGHFVKPVSPAALVRALGEALGSSDARAARGGRSAS